MVKQPDRRKPFELGQLVEFTELGRRSFPHPVNRGWDVGIVEGYGRPLDTVRVRLIGHRMVKTYHRDYWQARHVAAKVRDIPEGKAKLLWQRKKELAR